MGILFTNDANSTLQVALSSSDTTVVIALADAATFPQPNLASDYFMLVLEDRNQNPVLREICQCTARNSNSLTVTRAQENTTASAFNKGVIVSHRITAGTLTTLMASVAVQTTLYLGSFSSAPSSGVNGAVLIPGNLYYNTTSHQMFAFDGAFWDLVNPNANSTSFGVYLGAFSSPPITMSDGSALVNGTIYFNTTNSTLFEWDGSSWVSVQDTTANSTVGTSVVDGNELITGNLTVDGNGTFENITVIDDTSTGTLHLDGNLVVDAGDVSGGSNFQNFPAGTLMQWGSAAPTGGDMFHTTPVTFPVAFGATPIVVMQTAGNPQGAFPAVGSITSTSFEFSTLATAVCYWIAIGLQAVE